MTYMITTPIYYVNDIPHIGHAYTTLACDVMARYKRAMGEDVFFLTGTDEHGQKVEKSAEAKDMTPQAFTDGVSQRFRELADAMHFSHDDFIRTTEERHKLAAQALWDRLIERGHIYLGSYAGWYAVRDEAFYTEDELIEKDGQKTAPTGAPVEWVEEPSYFFNLSTWQDALLKHYEDNPNFILPESRRNEVISFVKGGLQDLSISRTSFAWGVKVPNDESHIMYVWLDALTNYLTAAGFPNIDGADYQTRWPANVHMVGKDILRFHAIYWPAFLMAADLPLPQRIVAHGWWTNEGQKISKSLGNVIDPLALINDYGLDQTRYFLMREVPFGNDGNFSVDGMLTRMNTELANTIGNLMQRSMSMIFKHCEAAFPTPQAFTADDETLLNQREPLLKAYHAAMDMQQFSIALEQAMLLARAANEYIDAQAPWALRKTDPERMKTVLYVVAEAVRFIALLLQPFIPDGATAMLDQLNIAPADRQLSAWNKAITPNTPITAPQGIFPRMEAAKAA